MVRAATGAVTALKQSVRLATLSFGIEVAGGLLVSALLARALGPVGFGVYGLWFGLATLVLLVLDSGTGPALTLEIAAGNAGRQTVQGLFLKRLGSAFGLIVAGFVAGRLLSPDHWVLASAVVASEALGYCVWIIHYAQRALLRENVFLAFLLGERVLLSVGLGTLLARSHGHVVPLEGIAIVIVTSRLVTIAMAAAYIRVLPALGESAVTVRKVANSGGVSGLLIQFTERGVQYVLPVLVVLIHGAAIGGAFQAAMKLLALPLALVNSVAKAALPRLIRFASSAFELRRLRLMLLCSAVIVGLIAGCAFLTVGDLLVHVMFGSSYSEAATVLSMMAFWPLTVSAMIAAGYIGIAAGMQAFVRAGNLWFVAAIVLGMFLSGGEAGNFLPLVSCAAIVTGTVLYKLNEAIRAAGGAVSAEGVAIQ